MGLNRVCCQESLGDIWGGSRNSREGGFWKRLLFGFLAWVEVKVTCIGPFLKSLTSCVPVILSLTLQYAVHSEVQGVLPEGPRQGQVRTSTTCCAPPPSHLWVLPCFCRLISTSLYW